MRQQSISVYFVKAVLKYAVARGLDPAALLRANRISTRLLAQEDARISIERFADLQVHTMLAMDDEGLGYGPQPLPVGSWSMLCYAVIHCDSIGKALARYCRFFRLFHHAAAPTLQVDDRHATVRLAGAGSSASYDVYGAELALFNCHRFMSWLAGELLPAVEFNFTHQAPPHAAEYRPMFAGNPVNFEQPCTEMVLNSALLEKPVVQNEQSLARFLRHPVLSMLKEQYKASSWTARVRQLLRKNLDRMPELEVVAAELDVHPQTLRRRLAAEGTSFTELKSQVRRDVALHYLGKQGLSIEEIAHRAGFSESSAFIRAFKGWTGVTPYTYRKGL
ncbi:MAG: AraC family transcriptional regulator [Halieaceae bacterium]|jgi:AraC-like DNA-binding protein|nr:AraC family transcriptional regulator [Halieaceae bacterium]